MLNIKNILDEVILEKWNPANKEKHSSCKAKVKSRVKVWPSAYASAQVVRCYYGKDIKENTEMNKLFSLFERHLPVDQKNKLKKQPVDESDCGCGQESITEATEAKKKKKKKRGSPWFRHKDTDALIPRKHPGRTFMTPAQIKKRKEIGDARIAKFKRDGGKLSAKAPNNPAMTMEEVIWAGATRAALGKKAKSGGNKKGSKKKGGKKKMSADEKKASIRKALKKIDSKRSKIKKSKE